MANYNAKGGKKNAHFNQNVNGAFNPCWNNGKGCIKNNRHVGCHATCEEYKKFKAEINRIHEVERYENRERYDRSGRVK